MRMEPGIIFVPPPLPGFKYIPRLDFERIMCLRDKCKCIFRWLFRKITYFMIIQFPVEQFDLYINLWHENRQNLYSSTTAHGNCKPCLIGDQHAWSETHQRLTCLIKDPLNMLEHAFRSPMGLQSDMSVSDGSPIRHVGIRWVSDGACRSPKASQSPMGLR